MKEIRYETPVENIDWNKQTVFLAGPTVRGNQPHLTSWRNEAITLFRKMRFAGNLIIPEFKDKRESDQYRYDLPVWEFSCLQKSDVIMFWVQRTRELIGLTTNCEFGYWMARSRMKMVYGRPDDAYRISYLDIMWVEDSKLYTYTKIDRCIHNTLARTVVATMLKF